MSIQPAEQQAANAALEKRAATADRGGDRQALLAKVQPLLLEDFKSEDVATLPRPELALRIGQIVTNELSDELDSLNLLERRNLVGDLITWLLNNSKPTQASTDLMKAKATHTAVQSRKKEEQADEAAPHTATVESAKSRIQPLVMERLDLTAASQLPRRELAYQVGEIVTELLQEEQIRLNGPEHQAVVDLMLDDMLGLGPLEPLLADESITDIMVNGPTLRMAAASTSSSRHWPLMARPSPFVNSPRRKSRST